MLARHINGVDVDQDIFQQKVNALRVAGFYNATHGLWSDVIEAAKQKFDGENDLIAQQFAQGLANLNHKITIIAHSQGTLTVANAAQYYGLRLPQGSHIEFRSPAISVWRAKATANAAGATQDYLLPYGDAAAIWAPSFNPVKRLWASFDLLYGLPIHTSTDP